MIKNILPLSCILMTSLHAMETVPLVEMTKTSLSLIYNGTKINLIKGYWEDATDTIELTVVGKQQQNMLQEKFANPNNIVGRICCAYGERYSIHKKKMMKALLMMIHINHIVKLTTKHGEIRT